MKLQKSDDPTFPHKVFKPQKFAQLIKAIEKDMPTFKNGRDALYWRVIQSFGAAFELLREPIEIGSWQQNYGEHWYELATPWAFDYAEITTYTEVIDPYNFDEFYAKHTWPTEPTQCLLWSGLSALEAMAITAENVFQKARTAALLEGMDSLDDPSVLQRWQTRLHENILKLFPRERWLQCDFEAEKNRLLTQIRHEFDGAGKPKAQQQCNENNPSMIKKSNFWEIQWNGKLIPVKAKKGADVLAYLLARPNREPIDNATIYKELFIKPEHETINPEAAEIREESGLTLRENSTEQAYEQLDQLSIEKEKRLKQHLEAELEQVQDPAKREEIQRQLNITNDHLRTSMTAKGESRTFSDKAESHSRTTGKNLKGLLKDIKEADESLYKHLDNSLHISTYTCSYTPEPPIKWIIEL